MEVAVTQSFALTIFIALLILTAMRKTRWQMLERANGMESFGGVWSKLRIIMVCVCWAIPLAAALGYVSLARFAIAQLILIGTLFVTIWLIHQVTHGSLNLAFQNRSQKKKVGDIDDMATLTATGNLLKFWLGTAINLATISVALAIVLPFWGVERMDMRMALRRVVWV